MTIKRIARIAMSAAALFVAQIVLSGIPNCELVSFLIICLTLLFGPEMLLTVEIFSCLEGVMWGFGSWVIGYMYTWPVLVLITLLLKKVFKEEFMMWAIVSGSFGLIFGAFFALWYIPIDISYALTYWIKGIPWDVWHCVTNFLIMLILGKPFYRAMKKVKANIYGE